MRDGTDGYGLPTIVLHWAAAAVVWTAFVLGWQAGQASGTPGRGAAIGLHISFAAATSWILWLRLGWRLFNRTTPPTPDQHPILKLLAVLVPRGILAAILIMIVSGPLVVFSNGRPINVFDWVSIPSPMAKNEALHEVLEVVHVNTAYVLVGLAVVHIAGALKHILFESPAFIMRMIAPRKAR